MANPLVELLATIKGLTSTIKVVATPEGHLYTARYLPDSARPVLDGKVFGFMETAAVATAQAIPTVGGATPVQVLLYNNEPSGGKTYVVTNVMWQIVASAAAIEDITLMGAVLNYTAQISGPAAPSNDLTTRFNMKALEATPGSSKSVVDLAPTLLTAPTWFTLKGGAHVSAVNDDGGAIVVNLDTEAGGVVVLPPGGGFALAALSTSASVTGISGMKWVEHQF